MTMNDSRFLALPLDAQMLTTTIKFTIAVNRKLTRVDEQQPNWLGMVLHREQDQQCSTGEVCWKY